MTESVTLTWFQVGVQSTQTHVEDPPYKITATFYDQNKKEIQIIFRVSHIPEFVKFSHYDEKTIEWFMKHCGGQIDAWKKSLNSDHPS